MPSSFAIGDRVRLAQPPPYLKTADSMPMLRPPDLLSVGAEGIVMEHRPGGYWSVRFQPGTFLLDSQYLQKVSPDSPEVDSPEVDSSVN
ncbi:uncharacterized protein XM38_006530 [Halomicronema hongdechloris C2206]|uniref:DUF3148 domain-containing protein n=1 Tax=Halomicronema hongdechloris C2206 TaxID=1641165 RepID=A0A1Z3HHF3_9CYAN|nr:DUF3148 domain-containing protein [Halomicronema hongdechloris]ASC69724.1 uncharacterized protein XM38_006530 [Halomicronema hongdechloris C2206]